MDQENKDLEMMIEEVAKKAFDAFDEDKSGVIDAKELEEIMIKIAVDMGAVPPTKEDIRELMEEVDVDKSGQIEYAEFKDLIRLFMSEGDEN
jgi:calmodulin